MTGHRGRAVAAVAVGFGVGVLATMALATPAAADVTVTPPTGTQGGALKLVFRVSEERAPAYTTKIDLELPQELPVAEVYPMNVPHWAPRITVRTLDKAVEAIHGVQTTEVASKITWTRAAKAPAKPSVPVEVVVALGPLPRADTMAFAVIQTYSDGKVVRWADQPGASPAANPAPTISLRPPAARTARHAGHGGSDAGGFGMLSAVALSATVTVVVLGLWFAALRVPRLARFFRRKRAGADRPASTEATTAGDG
jgi:uncharacterized protein YcnI